MNDLIEFTPPSNRPLELQILSSLMDSEVFNNNRPFIEPGWFYYHDVQSCVKKMLELGSNDVVLLSAAATTHGKAIEEALAYAPSLNLGLYLDELKTLYFRRRLIDAGMSLMSEAMKNTEVKPNELVSAHFSEIQTVITSSAKSRPYSIKELAVEVFDTLERAANKEHRPGSLRHGLLDVDTEISPIDRCELVVIAGRPSMGKTSLVLSMIRENSVKNDKMGIIFSLEMSRQSNAMRIMLAEAGISYELAMRGMIPKNQLSGSGSKMLQAAEGKIYIDDTPGLTAQQIVGRCCSIRGLDYAVVDHLGLVKTGSHRSRHEELSICMKEFKRMSGQLNIPVIIVSQLSREVERRSPPIPMISDLRESGSIEEDADRVYLLYRDEYYTRAKSTKKNTAEVIIGKNKNGRVGSFDVGFNKDTMTFFDLVKEDVREW